MADKKTRIALEPVSDVPETASVCHFDEIGESLQETVLSAEKQSLSPVTVDLLETSLIDERACDIVKFTDYYRINRL